MNKITGLKDIAAGTLKVFLTYPLECFSVLTAWYCAFITLNKYDIAWKIQPDVINHIMDAAGLVFLSSLAITLATMHHLKPGIRMVSRVAGAFLLFGLFYVYLDTPGETLAGMRLLFLTVTLHFLVAFAFFTGKKMNGLFWTFNKILFLRILTAFLYTLVLVGGLDLALLSLHYLFNLEIKSETYTSLDTFILIVFNSLYFLAGIPLERQSLEEKSVYPPGLRYFTQYVLMPLMLVYFLILISYTGKLVTNYMLPKGWVSLMILLYALFGILSILLIFPLRTEKEYPWIRLFSRFFFWTLIPLNILLYLAIYRRISDYGFTEFRFIVFLLSFWISGITAYFLSVKNPEIKLIPVSMFLAGMICLFSPWNAFSVSRRSQLDRLKLSLSSKYLPARQKLHSGKHSRIAGEGPDNAREIVNYLYDRYSYPIFQPLIKADLKRIYRKEYAMKKLESPYKLYQVNAGMKDTLASLFRLPSLNDYQGVMSFTSFELTSPEIPVNIKGYDRLYQTSFYQNSIFPVTVSIAGTVVLNYNRLHTELILKLGTDSLRFPLEAFYRIRKTDKNDTLTTGKRLNATGPVVVGSRSPLHQAELRFNSAGFHFNRDTLLFDHAQLAILVKDLSLGKN